LVVVVYNIDRAAVILLTMENGSCFQAEGERGAVRSWAEPGPSDGIRGLGTSR